MQSTNDPKIAEAQQAVDQIVSCLERGFGGFNISEIVKGGSLGHGTAVPGDYDIDLVIYSQDIKPEDILQSKLQHRLLLLHEFLMRSFPPRSFPQRSFPQYTYTRMTQHSLQFDFRCGGCTLAVDLLLSPYWGNDQHNFYRFLETVHPENRKQLTVCAAKWQVAFFKKIPNEVKEYIRRAKSWRNEKWPKGEAVEGRPSSYLMSLLVLRAYEIRETYETMTHALIRLVQSHQLDVYWADNPGDFYRRSDYLGLLPLQPRVIDPANPANNVWVSGVKGYRRGEKPSDYEKGDGNTALLKKYISLIDLSQSV